MDANAGGSAAPGGSSSNPVFKPDAPFLLVHQYLVADRVRISLLVVGGDDVDASGELEDVRRRTRKYRSRLDLNAAASGKPM